MAEKPESSPKLWHILVPAATTLLVALIGLGTSIYQTEKPIQLTEAARQALTAPPSAAGLSPTSIAQTLQAAVAATLAAVTPQAGTSALSSQATSSTPSITILNQLLLPVRIYVNNVDKGEVAESSSSIILLDSYPATLKWSVVKQTTQKGTPLGHEMGGTFTDIARGDEITIDNVVVDQVYFYPIITNPTSTDCDVTINKGWKSELITHAVASAKSNEIEFGYYQLYTNSNVTLDCDGQVYWWGQKPGEASSDSFYDEVEKFTGAIHFTLTP